MPQLVRGHQPPRRGADEIGNRAHYSHVIQGDALQSIHFSFLYKNVNISAKTNGRELFSFN